MSLVFLAVNASSNAVTYANYGQPSWMVDHGQFIATADDSNSAVRDLIGNVGAHTWDVVQGTNPYLSATYDGTNVTITAHNGSPKSATVSVLKNTFTATFTNGVATFPLSLHASVQSQRVTVTIIVSGFDNIYVECGSMGADIQTQMYKDSGGASHVVPYKNTDLGAYWTAQSFNPVWQPIDIATETGLTLQTVFGKILTALQQPTYTPIVLTADEQNGVNDLLNNVIPNIPVDLAHIAPVPAQGQPQAFDSHYNSFRSHWSTSGTARTNYMQDVANITKYVPLH